MTHALLSIAIVCATLQQGVPPKLAPKDAPAADPAQAKREAFLADVAAQALASDLALLERLDGRFGKTVSFRDAPAGDVLKAIKDGRPFYYLPDQDHGRLNAVFVPFFGIPAATVSALFNRGVKFEICEITLQNRNLRREQFIQEAVFTPSGVVRIAKLQKEGAAYIKP